MSRRLTAVSFVAAAVLILAGMLATPWEDEQTTTSYLSAYVGHETQGQIAAVLLHFGYLLVVPAVFGLLAALAEAGAGRLRTVGGALAVLGWVSLPGLLAVDFYAIALVEKLPLEQAVAIEDHASGLAGAAVIGMTAAIPAFVGLALLLVAAARARLVHAAVPAMYLAGVVASVGGGGIGPAMIGGSVAVCAALVLVARGVLAGPREHGSAAPAVAATAVA